jgi:hypothetical protein
LGTVAREKRLSYVDDRDGEPKCPGLGGEGRRVVAGAEDDQARRRQADLEEELGAADGLGACVRVRRAQPLVRRGDGRGLEVHHVEAPEDLSGLADE